jgi:hypothetical protein
MEDAAQWTLDELSELVAGALRVVDYQGQPSRRVREVPDRRTIRYYTTIALLDRPAAMRGRTALYGRRHLIQLVAVKRLQSLGRSLVEVQSELVGATDATLEGLARIPADLALSNGSAEAVAAAPVPVPALAPVPAPDRSALRFWAAAAPATVGRDIDSDTGGATEPDTVTDENAAAAPPVATTIPALRLGTGVTLLLGSADHAPTAEDARLIGEAARPLLDLLLRRGLDVPGLGREIR